MSHIQTQTQTQSMNYVDNQTQTNSNINNENNQTQLDKKKKPLIDRIINFPFKVLFLVLVKFPIWTVKSIFKLVFKMTWRVAKIIILLTIIGFAIWGVFWSINHFVA